MGKKSEEKKEELNRPKMNSMISTFVQAENTFYKAFGIGK